MFLILAQTPQPEVSPTPPIPPTPQQLFIAPNPGQITSFVTTLVISLGVSFLLYAILFYVLRPLFRRLDKEIGTVTLNILQLPLAGIFLFLSLKITLHSLSASALTFWVDKVFTALIVVCVSYLVAKIFTEVVAYYLKRYAQQSEAMWDDTLLPLLESIVPVVSYSFGGFLFLQTFGIDLTGLWVAFGGATFVLGFALRDILANFFGGLVLLIDTPFQFGDVISLQNGSTAVIKHIGIRLTKLFIIDNHCEMFIPNGALQNQNIINLSRPAPFYYYTLNVPLRGDTEPDRAIKILREVVLAHPDTLGNFDEKINLLGNFYKFDVGGEFSERKVCKLENARQRLLTEREVNKSLEKIKQMFEDLVSKIQFLEKGGLEVDENRQIQGFYLDIVKLVGLEMLTERQGKRRISQLVEIQDKEDTLINLLRKWYKAWSKDPDLSEEDAYLLQDEWERKITRLNLRLNKLFQKITQAKIDETRLDDLITKLSIWLDKEFKTIQNAWQDPKIWTDELRGGGGNITDTNYVVKFYVDNIKLEQCQRGLRVKSEVQAEMIRQLRQAYLYR